MYEDESLEACYEFACEYVCDAETASIICDSVGKYGSEYVMVSADEWYRDRDDALCDYDCLIGEDVALDFYIIALK